MLMNNWQRPELLYHYTTRETAIEKIFLNGTIRLGKLSLTNDPQETAVGGFGISAHDNEPVGLRQIFADCERLTTKPVRLACFTQTPNTTPIIAGCNHDRMWAQYAGNNSGVCIAFNQDRLTANVERHFDERIRAGKGLLIHGSVEYVSEMPIQDGIFFGLSSDEMNVDGIKARRNERAKQRYLRKTIDWGSEHEYRYVWIDADDDYDVEGEYVPIRDCVETIYLTRCAGINQ